MTSPIPAAIKAAMFDPAAPHVITAQQQMAAARTRLMMQAPFFGMLSRHLEIVASPLARGTACTDGHKIYINPVWVNALTVDECVGLIAHETMHVALEHHLRRGARDSGDWNKAADYVINSDLVIQGFKLPAGGLISNSFRGMATEPVYDLIHREPEPQPEPPPQPTGGGGGGGEDEPQGGGEPQGSGEDEPQESESEDNALGNDENDASEDESDSEADASENGGGGEDEQVEDETPQPWGGVMDSPTPVEDRAQCPVNLLEAAMMAAAAGCLPASMREVIKELTKTKVNFADLLAEFVERNFNDDYSWSQPSRRYISQGIYLPALKSDAMPELAIIIDSSSSVHHAKLQFAMSAAQDCINQVQPERVHVFCVNTHIHWRRTFERGEALTWDISGGGGGTEFTPAFQAMAAEGIDPKCVLYFTDGDCGWYGDIPTMPVLWLLHSGARQQTPYGTPFGESVLID
jgi:predicted metal-dependent peptidase